MHQILFQLSHFIYLESFKVLELDEVVQRDPLRNRGKTERESMKVRKFNNLRDYNTLTSWLRGHNLSVFPVSSLSQNGFMVECDGKDIVCGFLYSTDSDMGWIECIVKNPKIDKYMAGEAISVVWVSMLDRAKEMGMRVILCVPKQKQLIEKAKQLGFTIIERDVSLMMRRFG